MDRKQAWNHYFTTGDREPLIKAYWDSINYIAWSRYRNQQEDMFQVGMLGLLKAIKTVDPKRVKSLDAWVWLNVRGMMFNVTKPKPVEYLNDLKFNHGEFTVMDSVGEGDDVDMRIDLKDAILSSSTVEEVCEKLQNYTPLVMKDEEKCIKRYHQGDLTVKGMAHELGISKRQAYKLLGTLPASW